MRDVTKSSGAASGQRFSVVEDDEQLVLPLLLLLMRLSTWLDSSSQYRKCGGKGLFKGGIPRDFADSLRQPQ
jgi:hypothetical protein